MEEKKKKKVSLPIVIIIIIVFVVLGWIGGYYFSDKMDDLLGLKEDEPAPKEEQQQVVKLTDEEISALHDSLVTTSGGFGFYFDESTSIEDIPANVMLKYAWANYFDENAFNPTNIDEIDVCGANTTEYYFCTRYSENKTKLDNDKTNNLTFKKEVIDQYIKEKFNTTKEFIYTEHPVGIKTTKGAYSVYYNSNNEEYYAIIPHGSGDTNSIKNKLVDVNQTADQIEITDKAIVCVSTESGTSCDKNLRLKSEPQSASSWLDNVLVFQTGRGEVYDSSRNLVSDGSKYFTETGYNFDALFEDFDSKLPTFKHTFKKADDGKFYWYSSEMVK